MHTAFSFTTLSASGTRCRIVPKAWTGHRCAHLAGLGLPIPTHRHRSQEAAWTSRPRRLPPANAGPCREGTQSGGDSRPGTQERPAEAEEAGLPVSVHTCACQASSSLRGPPQDPDLVPYLPLEGPVQRSHDDRLPGVGHGLAELHDVRELESAGEE